ncbi:MAG: hypothetical protein GWN84_20565 [Gammaproteobacteria bacterium]|nr:hypothetical protein [Gammaproteobacteria bacterium]NIR85155.1 hypothetical protein [Gammaproteobacteria bacterium]NIU06204.1 hypothetical protein [Gammaproteobacteria bacterium]NIX87477.1 hypothetical protein [Gammaproteobacteria bacterium]
MSTSTPPYDAGCSDADFDTVCDADDLCPGGNDSKDEDADGVPDACDACPEAPDFDDEGNSLAESCDQLLWRWPVELSISKPSGTGESVLHFIFCVDPPDQTPCDSSAGSTIVGWGRPYAGTSGERFYLPGGDADIDSVLQLAETLERRDRTVHIGLAVEDPVFRVETIGPFQDAWITLQERTITRLRRVDTVDTSLEEHTLTGAWEIYGH